MKQPPARSGALRIAPARRFRVARHRDGSSPAALRPCGLRPCGERYPAPPSSRSREGQPCRRSMRLPASPRECDGLILRAADQWPISLRAVKQPTPLDVVTLIIAVVGALSGVAALAWSVAAHLLTGPRVKVVLRGGWMNGTECVTVPINAFLAITPPEGFPAPVVAVHVYNSGRSPVQITTWAVSVGAATYNNATGPGNDTLPCLLGPGEERMWYADRSFLITLVAMLNSGGNDVDLTGMVTLGTGRSVRSRKHDPKAIGFNRAG